MNDHLEDRLGLKTPEEVSAHIRFVQCWLYFGVSSEFSRRVVEPEFRRKDEESQNLINTLGLGRFIHKAMNDTMSESASVRLQHYTTFQVIVTRCNEHMALLDEWQRGYGSNFPLVGIVALSISCLATALELSLHSQLMDLRHDRIMTSWHHGEYARSRFKDKGMCPRVIRMLETELDPPEVYYASMLSWPEDRHKCCDESRCVCYDIDEETYITQHTRASCRCAPVVADETRLDEVLHAGGIPTLETSQGMDGTAIVSVVESRKREMYVAISVSEDPVEY